MARKANPFETMYTCVRDEKRGVGVAYDRKGNYSVFIRMENPVEQFCADTRSYYDACRIFKSVIDTLGRGLLAPEAGHLLPQEIQGSADRQREISFQGLHVLL